jgi:hypothetical protein
MQPFPVQHTTIKKRLYAANTPTGARIVMPLTSSGVLRLRTPIIVSPEPMPIRTANRPMKTTSTATDASRPRKPFAPARERAEFTLVASYSAGMQELEVPDDAHRNPEALEVLRMWALPSDEFAFVTRRFPVDDPALLGILFADLARHFFDVAGKERASWGAGLRRVAEGLLAEASVEGN